MLSQSDWYKSNLFQLYLKFGRGLLRDPKGIGAEDQVYTEVELRYYIEYLRQMTMKKYRDDITPAEMEHILHGHNVKSYATLRWLMKLISFDYYYEKILLRYQQSEEEKAS